MTNTLSYEGFKHIITSHAEKVFLEECGAKSIQVREAVKNNDTVLDAMYINFEEDKCNPCLYINDLYSAYEEGHNIEEIIGSLKFIFEAFSAHRLPGGNELAEAIEDLEICRPLIECRLINERANRRRLEGRPYKRFGEFALSYQIKVGDGGEGFYFTMVTDELLETWGIDLDELHQIALQNMNLAKGFVLKNLQDTLELPQKSRLFILTRKPPVNGATNLISGEVLQKASKYLGGDFYILPSSVHELLLMPKEHTDNLSYLLDTVRSANRTPFVSSDEYLSDNVYEYDAEGRQVLLSETGEVLTLEDVESRPKVAACGDVDGMPKTAANLKNAGPVPENVAARKPAGVPDDAVVAEDAAATIRLSAVSTSSCQ
ncbi:MAG: DUF5688 family protein [Bacillota bacterium]|nr:DUF5688 family protein [Bacillota bacterium]